MKICSKCGAQTQVPFKPIEGRASIGCRRINNRTELNSIRNSWQNYVVQEYIGSKTDIVAVDIVRNKKTNQVEIAQRLELMRNSNGCGVAVEIVDNPKVREACLKIAEMLDINGVVNTEFFIKTCHGKNAHNLGINIDY